MEPNLSESRDECAACGQTGIERRAFPRRRPRGSASIRPADKPMVPDVRVKLTCISQGGVCFLATKKLEVDHLIEVILQSPAAAVPLLTIRATVVRVVGGGSTGEFRVGCEWLERLSYGQLIPFW